MFYRCNILCTFIYFISTALVLGENQSSDKICIPFKHVFSIFIQLSSPRFLFVPGIVISPKSQGSYLGLNLKTLLEPHYYFFVWVWVCIGFVCMCPIVSVFGVKAVIMKLPF